VTAFRLLVNGRPYRGESGLRKVAAPGPGEVRASWSVELEPGVYHLAAVAESPVSLAVSPPVEVRVGEPGADDPPARDGPAGGINDYPFPMQLRYAAPNARAIATVFREKAGDTFRHVEVNVLTDAKATRKGFEEGLDWLAAVMTHRDVGVVFFCGH